MEIDLLFVREKVLRKQLDAFHIQETCKKVDMIFTKPLPTTKFLEFRIKINGVNPSIHPP
jgi:hypothetical protein